MSHNGVVVDFDDKNNGGVRVCTIATKPSSPFEGQVIYVTDNSAGDELEAWDGSAWQTIAGTITGVDGTTFTLDEDNAGTGVNCAFKANRGTTGGDARVLWNEASDQWELDDSAVTVPLRCSLVKTKDGIYFDDNTGDYKIAENDTSGDLEITVPTGKSIVFKAV